MSKQEEIVAAVINKLKEITTANGYVTDIGNNVNDWNSDKIQEGTPEYVEIQDPETVFVKRGEPGYLEQAHKQHLKLQVLLVFEKKPITQSRKAVADVYKLIGSNRQYFWDNHQIIIQPVSHNLDISKEDRTITGAQVILDIEFVTTLWGLDV